MDPSSNYNRYQSNLSHLLSDPNNFSSENYINQQYESMLQFEQFFEQETENSQQFQHAMNLIALRKDVAQKNNRMTQKFITRFTQEIQHLGSNQKKKNTLNSVIETFKNSVASEAIDDPNNSFEGKIESLPHFNTDEKQTLRNIGLKYLGLFFQECCKTMIAKNLLLECEINKVEEIRYNSKNYEFKWKGALAEYCNVQDLDVSHLEKFVNELFSPQDSQLATFTENWKKCISYFVDSKGKKESIQTAIEKFTYLFTDKYFALNFKSVIESPHFSGCYTEIEERCKQINSYIEKNPEQFTQKKVELCISQLPGVDRGINCHLFFIITPKATYVNGEWEYTLIDDPKVFIKPFCLILPFKFDQFNISFIDFRSKTNDDVTYGLGESDSDDKTFLAYRDSKLLKGAPLPQKSFEPSISSTFDLDSEKKLDNLERRLHTLMREAHNTFPIHKPANPMTPEVPEASSKTPKKKKVNAFERALQKSKEASQSIQPRLIPSDAPKVKPKASAVEKSTIAPQKVKVVPKEAKQEDFVKKLEDKHKKNVFYRPAEDKSISPEKRYSVTVSVRLGKTTSNIAVGEGRTAHSAKQNAAENYLKGNVTLQSHKKEKKPVLETKKIVPITKKENVPVEMNSNPEQNILIEQVSQPILQTISEEKSEQETAPAQHLEKKSILSVKILKRPKPEDISPVGDIFSDRVAKESAKVEKNTEQALETGSEENLAQESLIPQIMKKEKKAAFSVKKILKRPKDENSEVKIKAKEKSLKVENSVQPIFHEEVEKSLVIRQEDVSEETSTEETSKKKKDKKSNATIFLKKIETCGHLVTHSILRNKTFTPHSAAQSVNNPSFYRDILNQSTIDEIQAQIYNRQIAVYVMHKNLEQLNALYSTLVIQHSILNRQHLKLETEWNKIKTLQGMQSDDSSEDSADFLARGKKIEGFNKVVVEEVKANTFIVGNPPVEELEAGETIPHDTVKIPFDPETRVIRIQTTHETSSFKVVHKGGKKLELDIEVLQQQIKLLETENAQLQQKIDAHTQN